MPRLPEVGERIRNIGTLVDIQDVTPLVVRTLHYVFETSEAILEARINGRKVTTLGTFHDFFGPRTHIKNAIVEAGTEAEKFGASDLEFVVVERITYARYVPQQRVADYQSEFLDFSRVTGNGLLAIPDSIERDVWSSQRGDLEP